MTQTPSDPEPQAKIDWRFWIEWVLACTLAVLIGVLTDLLIVGALIGLAQWLVLRQMLPRSEWWILASILGWLGSWLIVETGLPSIADPIIRSVVVGATFGLGLGLAQWVLLQRRVQYALLWLPINVVSWAVGLTGIFGATVTGAVVGAATGLVLDWLLRHPRLPSS